MMRFGWALKAVVSLTLCAGEVESLRADGGAKSWPYVPLELPAVPKVRDSAWPHGPIDHFVLVAQEQRGLKPGRDASPQVLLRRLCFDLTGLPPTPAQVGSFRIAAEANLDSAVDRLIDELLASPHYAERWARYWLDVARYAEDQAHNGHHNVHAFQYRDWVQRAFSVDMPLEEFVRLQVAGDLQPYPKDESHDDRFVRLAGLGFFGLGAVYYKNSDREQAMADELDDQIDTFTRGFLGLTVSCARCHDHKFDPISIEDYYSMAGIFNGSRPGHSALGSQKMIETRNAAVRKVNDQNRKIQSWLEVQGRGHSAKEIDRLSFWLRLAWKLRVLEHHRVGVDLNRVAKDAGTAAYYVNRWREHARRGAKELTPDLLKLFANRPKEKPESFQELQVPDDAESLIAQIEADAKRARDHYVAHKKSSKKEDESLLQSVWLRGNAPLRLDAKHAESLALSASQKAELKSMRTDLSGLQEKVPQEIPKAATIGGHGRAMQVFLRGDPRRKGEWVARGFLNVLDPGSRPSEEKAAKERKFTRVELADAIVSKSNPLTARVYVNRIWQWHFGRGIVATASNFGSLGDRPTHPELLDWLTASFVAAGQSTKWLHRAILSSRTYRLASGSVAQNEEVDAENIWLWRSRRRRLDVEAMRDALLAASGELDSRVGGSSRSVDDRSNRRRTFYSKISRHQPSEFLRTFDFPDANV
ncbi:MAG: DUF1549 and DUF1553 domain-containing protein, partial [Planctomycetota bacterium]